MDKPFFSIIIPVYNVERFVEHCVDSILSQTYRNYEIILVDDGSTDRSGMICDKIVNMHNHVQVVHKRNGGSSSARNAGMQQANGEYLIFIDSDDYYANINGLQDIHDSIINNNYDVVLYGCIVYDLENKTQRVSRGNYDLNIIAKNNKETTLSYLFSSGLFPGAAWIYAVKKELISDVAKVEFPMGLTAEDYYWTENILHAASSIGAVNNNFYTYVINREGSITTKPRLSGVKGILYAVEDWMKKDTKEDGITDFLAQSYLLALMNYAKLDKNDRVELKEAVNSGRTILRVSSQIKFKVCGTIASIVGEKKLGDIIYYVYKRISKRKTF